MRRKVYINLQDMLRIKEIGIELVHGCNLNCRMCPIIKLSPPEYMGIGQLKRILDNLKPIKYGKRLFLVGRGETLLHPEIENIFSLLEHEKIYKKFEYRYIYTNATVLIPEIIRILCNYNVVNDLVFSLSGHGDKQTCEYWMGNGAWEKIVEGINNFVNYYEENKRHIISYKISIIVPDYNMVPFAPISQEEIAGKIQSIFGKNIPVIFRSMHDYDGQNALFPGKKCINDSCYRLIEGDWNFRADGSIVPCCHLVSPSEKVMIGNINKNSLEGIYYGEKFQYLKQLLSANNRDKVEICKRCTLISHPEKHENNSTFSTFFWKRRTPSLKRTF